MFKSLVKSALGANTLEQLRIALDRYAVASYAQEGEDLLLMRALENQHSGFYVDVGAHHPARFSNTYLFYKQGWRGINIDATPGSMKPFLRYRPRDINLEIAVSELEEEKCFHIFNEPALNGFDAELSEQRDQAATAYRLLETVTVRTQRLSVLLDEYLPAGIKIDFLTIDVEGLDLSVLRSNDWSKYRPRFVLVEILMSDLVGLGQTATARYLHEQGYVPFARTFNTVFFREATR